MHIQPIKWFYLLLYPVLIITASTTDAAQPASDRAKALYREECASCHMAYPPDLLPARSWQKILDTLDQHFGDNASLEPALRQSLLQYLKPRSADAVQSRRARRLLRSISAHETPLRISELTYIRRRHDEIPARYIRANPQVKSLSNCVACHQGAERGVFNEDTVRIPGYGRWDD